jgi:hypothetical protein
LEELFEGQSLDCSGPGLSEGRILRMIAALDIYLSDNRTDQAQVNG